MDENEQTINAAEYFKPLIGIEQSGGAVSPELARALHQELLAAHAQAVETIKKQRTERQQAPLIEDYHRAVEQTRKTSGNLAALRVEFTKRGLYREAEVTADDPQVWAVINNQAAEIIERVNKRVSRGQAQAEQDRLQSAYEAELAKIPRGSRVAIMQLRDKFRKMGWHNDGLPPERPEPERKPHLNQEQQIILHNEYLQELAKIRGQSLLIIKLQHEYRKRGLNI